MDEVSGLRARRDKIRDQIAAAKKGARDDWEATRRRVDAAWTDFRRDVATSTVDVEWDDARERRWSPTSTGRGGAQGIAGRGPASRADARVEISKAQQELREHRCHS
jgi:hypothetical protein